MKDTPEISNYITELKDKLESLNWTLDGDPELLPSRSHVLLKFKVNTKYFLYRRAIRSPQQIKRQLIAHQIMGDNIGKVHYSDKYSIIIDYMIGQTVTPEANQITWKNLGRILSNIHQNPCSGFGPLILPDRGSYSSHYNFIYPDLINLRVIHQANLLSWDEINKLENYILNPPKSASPHTVICHSDVWPQNVIFDSESQKTSLIDWEQISSNHPEYDLFAFANNTHPDSDNIFKTILSGYQQPLNPDLINYFILLTNVSRFDNINNPLIESLATKIQSLKPLFINSAIKNPTYP